MRIPMPKAGSPEGQATPKAVSVAHPLESSPALDRALETSLEAPAIPVVRVPTLRILGNLQEHLVVSFGKLFGETPFDLSKVDLQGLRPYQVRDELNAMVPLGLVASSSKNEWQITATGVALASLLAGLQERKVEINDERVRKAWEYPEFFKLDKVDMKFALRTIPDFIAQIGSGEIDLQQRGREDAFLWASYANATHATQLEVDLDAMLNGTWDTRFTHVLLWYNTEGK